MRDIIFRGKRSYDKKWVYGSFVKIDNKCHIIQDEDIEEYGHHFMQVSDNPTWVDEETVGQFTGLLDKNGKEIYEGDIIETITFGFDAEKFTSVIEFKKCSFSLSSGRNIFYYGQKDCNKMDDSRVVGNIHDNPELLIKTNQ